MKQCLLLCLLLVLMQSAFAQDKIVKLDSNEMKVRVLEIKLQGIAYQHPDSAEGKVYLIPKSDVFMVQYANGAKEVITETSADTASVHSDGNVISRTPEQMYELGQYDAQRLYEGANAKWGSVTSGLFLWYGLAASVAIGSVRPKATNNPVSDKSYLLDPNYVKGYEDRAHKKKLGKVAAGTAIGSGITLGLRLFFMTIKPGK